MTPLLCTCAVVITLETQKCRKRAPLSVEFNFFIICDRPSPRMPHTLAEIFTHAQLLDFKNHNSWAGRGQRARRSSSHVLSEPGTIAAASAVASYGRNYWQRILESCSSSSSLQRGWSLVGRATVPRVLYGIGLRMSVRRRTILSQSLRAPARVALTIHTFRSVDRTAGRRFVREEVRIW